MRTPELLPAIRKAAQKDGDLYCRLALAAEEGRGIRLTAADVFRLVRMDDAIETAAETYAEEKYGTPGGAR